MLLYALESNHLKAKYMHTNFMQGVQLQFGQRHFKTSREKNTPRYKMSMAKNYGKN